MPFRSIQSLFSDPAHQPGDLMSAPLVDGPPVGLSVRWEQAEDCGECGGSGDVICEYGHDHECPECCGNGVECVPCEEAMEEVPVVSGSDDEVRIFARRYIWLLQQLPDLTLYRVEAKSMLFFRWLGGCGLLMGLSPERYRITVADEAAAVLLNP